MTRPLLALALLTALTAVSCSDDTTTTPDPPTPPATSFANRLPKGGVVARSFNTSQAGVITVTIKSTTPNSSIGVGLGIPLTGGLGNCGLTVSLNTSGGSQPQIAQSAAAGTYCVIVYDNGSLAGPIDFDATIVYPYE